MQPRIITVVASRVDEDVDIEALVTETRAQAVARVFLSGGAAGLSSASEQALVRLFEALAILAAERLRFAVADGGTAAGIMQAAGRARAQSPHRFPRIGVSPMREIVPYGSTPVDPNHTVIVAIDNPEWDATDGYFGSETGAMYGLFARLAAGKPSVAVVANGGEITMTEVDQHIRAERPMILVNGSGRAADALVSLLDPARPMQADLEQLRTKAMALDLLRRPSLFHIVDLAGGPRAFADTLRRRLAT
jgi:hypothetical protein